MGVTPSTARVPLALALAVAACTGGAGPGRAVPQPVGDLATRPVASFVTDSSVESIAIAGDVVYAAGFIRYLGPRTGAFVLFKDGGARPAPNVPPIFGGDAVDGFVQAIVPDGRGGWIVGGSFTRAGGRRCARFARITPDRRLDPRFCVSPNAAVTSLAVRGRTVYLGGGFTRVNGKERIRLAAVSLTSGRLLPWTVTVTGGPYYDRQERVMPSVDALALDGTTLFVGGLFDVVGGQPRVGIAAVDTTVPRVTGWHADLGPPRAFNWVRVLAARSGTVYVAGLIARIGNQRVAGVGAIDAATARPLRWAPRFANVTAIIPARDRVYLAAAGNFCCRSVVVAVSPRTGAPLRAFPTLAIAGGVSDFALTGRRLLIAGDFTRVASSARTHLAAVDARTGRVLPWSPRANAAVHTVSVARGYVAAGGTLTSAGGVTRQGLAAIDGRTGELMSWAPEITGTATTVSTDGSRLYVGGDFTHVDGRERFGLAAFDVQTGKLLDWAPKIDAPEKEFGVEGIATLDGRVYVAGEFAHVDGKPRERLAALDAENGEVMNWNPKLRGTADERAKISDLEAFDGRVYVAGTFTFAGGRSHESLAEIDAESGRVDDWAPTQNGLYGVQTVAATPQALYLGGDFGKFAGTTRRGLAAVDAESHELFPWAPSLGRGTVGTAANDIVAVGSMLAVAGDFRSANGAERAGVALFDGSTGTLIEWEPPPTERAEYAPDSIAASTTLLAFDGYAGGNADSVSVYRFGRQTVGRATR